jgi:hypothetical protein
MSHARAASRHSETSLNRKAHTESLASEAKGMMVSPRGLNRSQPCVAKQTMELALIFRIRGTGHGIQVHNHQVVAALFHLASFRDFRHFLGADAPLSRFLARRDGPSYRQSRLD